MRQRTVERRGAARGGLVAGALLAVATLGACGTLDDDETGEAPGADEAEVLEGLEVTSPGRGELPELDRSQASVALDDIHFNTFDGSSVPLAEASRELVERLRDRIPPITSPRYVRAGTIAGLEGDDLVLGYVSEGGQAYAYPVPIMNFHEIVNEEIDGVPLVVTYCPLCRSGVVFDRRVDGRELHFGNTSALYEADLVMYDHETNSYWWQVAGRAIVGELADATLDVLASTTTTWADWVERHPDSWVLSADTGFERPYDAADPFAGYREALNEGRFPFPVSEETAADGRLDAGEEVLGVEVDGEARAYPLRELGDAVVNDELGGRSIVVFSRAAGPTGSVFDRRADERTLTFALRDGEIVDEDTGSRWSVDGVAVDGPLAGTQLEALPSRFAFWVAFTAAFPDADVARP